MRMGLTYLGLLIKRCAKSFGVVLIIILLGFGLFAGIYKLITNALDEEASLSIMKVGMVIPDKEDESRYVSDMIFSMNTIKNICEVDYLKKDEALAKLEAGELNAVIELPDNFFHDVQVGINPPATIYFPSKMGLMEALFKELIIAGVSYLDTAEAGVYSSIELAIRLGLDKEASSIGNRVAILFLNTVLKRETMYERKVLTPLGNMSLERYYFISGMIFIMMFSGIIYARMHTREEKAVESKLRINGISTPVSIALKMLVMIMETYIVGLCICTTGLWISRQTDIILMENLSKALVNLLFISIQMSVYFEIIYILASSKDGSFGRFVLIILNFTTALCSGLFIPMAYLSENVRKVGEYLPMKYWIDMMNI